MQSYLLTIFGQAQSNFNQQRYAWFIQYAYTWEKDIKHISLNTLACFIGIYIVTINVKYVPAEGSIYTSNALKRIQEQRFAKAHEAATRTWTLTFTVRYYGIER